LKYSLCVHMLQAFFGIASIDFLNRRDKLTRP